MELRFIPTPAARYALSDSSSSCTHLALWFLPGPAADPPRKSGLAHLYEHLFFEAADGDTRAFLEDDGADLSAATFSDCVRVTISLPPDVSEGRFRTLLSGLLSSRHWRPGVVEREAAAVRAEARERNDDPQLHSVYGAIIGLRPGSPVARWLTSEADEVGNVVAGDLQEYHRSLHPGNTIVGVAGESADWVAAAVEEALGEGLPGDDNLGMATSHPGEGLDGGTHLPAPRVGVSRRVLGGLHLALAFGLPDRPGRQASFELLDQYLCGGLASRLAGPLKESAGVYDVTSGFDFHGRTVTWYLYTCCAADSTYRVLEAVAESLTEVAYEAPPEATLSRLRAKSKVAFLCRTEAPLATLRWMGSTFVALGSPFSPTDWVERLGAVERGDLSAAAQYLLDTPPSLYAVGPAPSPARLRQELGRANRGWSA